MSISIKAIDRLFERLAATYGSAWSRQWSDVPLADVKTAWAHELSGYGGRLEVLAWALENLPERAPNIIEFRNLCRRSPAPEAPRLPEPKADPERLARELSKLQDLKQSVSKASKVDNKAWAKKILQRHADGEKTNPTSIRFAKEALQ
jgi:hypothetical protein